MIVVADTSPLNYLIQLQLEELLKELYGRILIPIEVKLELQAVRSPESVRLWIAAPPSWIEILAPALSLKAELNELDPGERAAIELALEFHADLLLLDEMFARQIVKTRFGIKVTGTLGVLRDAHKAGVIDGRAAFHRLCATTSFYHSEALKELFLASL